MISNLLNPFTMTIIAGWLALAALIIIVWIIARRGWFGILYAASHLFGLLVDVVIQAGLSVGELFKRKIRLDDHEEKISG